MSLGICKTSNKHETNRQSLPKNFNQNSTKIIPSSIYKAIEANDNAYSEVGRGRKKAAKSIL